MPIIEIENENLCAGINTFGCELTYVKKKSGEELLWSGDEKIWPEHSPLLFPICGGLKDDTYIYGGKKYKMPKHGFAKRTEFKTGDITPQKAEFILCSNDETKKIYPFEFKLTVIFGLDENSIKITYRVENTGNKDMYFSIGSHEGYSCPEGIEEYYIEFPEEQTLDSFLVEGSLISAKTERIIENERILPLKNSYFEIDALVFKNIPFHKAALVKKDKTKRIEVEFDGCDYFLLWTKPNAPYICLEPWSGMGDNVGAGQEIEKKEGIISLKAGGEYENIHTVKFF